MPLFRLFGLIALVAGPFALILAILRFLFVATAEPPEILFGDPLLWMALIGSALSTLYGVVTVFGGYNPAQSLRAGGPKTLAVASFLCGVGSILLFPLGVKMLAFGGGIRSPVRIVGLAVVVVLLLAIIGIVLGHAARSRIRKEPQQPGGSLALLALFVCYAVVILPFVLSALRH